MIRQRIYLEKYNWHVACFYAVDTYWLRDIMDELAAAGCPPVDLVRARDNIASGNLNQGLTWSNPRTRHTIMVTSLSSTPAEFFNTLMHELMHATLQISRACGLQTGGEEQAYLMGDLSKAVFPKIKHLLCTQCRKKYTKIWRL